MVLDLLKETSDDAFYTDEHVVFLANHLRAYLIERKYRRSRNTPFASVSDQNKQQICIDLEKTDMLPGGCGGYWLKSTEKIPDMVDVSEPTLSTPSDMLFSAVTWIAPERMPYIGYNKWLKNIIYAAKSTDGYLYLTGQSPYFQHLEQLKMEAVFNDAEAAAAMSCEADSSSGECVFMDSTFPLEDALVMSCIEMIVQEIAGSRYAPEDKENDASDELSDVNMARSRAGSPVTYDDRAEANNEARIAQHQS